MRVAVATVHRPSFARLKGNLALFTTRSAYRGMHLPRPLTTASRIALPPGLPTGGATLGLIGKALVCVELLLRGIEGKVRAAFDTLQGLVHVSHGRPPFLKYSGYRLVRHGLGKDEKLRMYGNAN